MARYIKPETPVVDYRPRSVAFSRREYLLWPAYCYHVVAPRIREQDLNILQKAVLGFLRAGAYNAIAIADWLHIERDLAAQIIAELLQDGFIDSNGLVTADGLGALDEQLMGTHEVQTGFIYQDPWTRELYPRFMTDQPTLEVDESDPQGPRLILGSTGNPKPMPVFVVKLDGDACPVLPHPQAVLDANNRHRRAVRRQGDLATGEYEEHQASLLAPEAIDRISFIQDQPTLVYLTTFLYRPQGLESGIGWQVRDPFGLESSQWLYRSIEARVQKNLPLRNLVGRITGLESRDPEAYGQLMARLAEAARQHVEDRFDLSIRRSSLYDLFVVMERARQEALALGNACPTDKLDDVLIKAQKVMEALFEELHRDHGDNRYVPDISASPDASQRNYEKLNQYAAAMGFDIPLPQRLQTLPGNRVGGFAYKQKGSLVPRFVVALLSAYANPTHPMRGLASEMPDLFDRLTDLANARDGSSHAGGHRLTLDDIASPLATVYDVAHYFHNHRAATATV